jgi:hypothetical protein
LVSAVCLLSVAAGIASAQPPITFTEVSTFSETFSDEPFLCQDELYTVTGTGHTVFHITFFEETGALHLHEVIIGKAVAVPLDGTGPSYTANFRDSDSENIRAVKHGEGLVEVDTDLHKAVAHGSDGSRVFFKEHAHFTVNANGEMSVDLHTIRMVCP